MIPIPEGVSKASESALEQIVARVVIVGTFAIGLFSGIGAAVNMSRFLPIFIDSRRCASCLYNTRVRLIFSKLQHGSDGVRNKQR